MKPYMLSNGMKEDCILCTLLKLRLRPIKLWFNQVHPLNYNNTNLIVLLKGLRDRKSGKIVKKDVSELFTIENV